MKNQPPLFGFILCRMKEGVSPIATHFSAANLHVGNSGNPRFSFVKNQGFAAAAASGCVPASENCPLNSLQVASGNVPDLFFTASKNVPDPFSAASGSVPELTFLPREACQS